VAIARGVDRALLAQELGATHYIDSDATDATEALQALGGAAVILVTAPAAEAASALVSGLRRNGTMIVVADTGSAALSILPRQIIFGSRTIRNWYSGQAKDAEETPAFAAQAGIRPISRCSRSHRSRTLWNAHGRARLDSASLGNSVERSGRPYAQRAGSLCDVSAYPALFYRPSYKAW
jgi:D-arabinose 1-dehydrogenase-like Zn-dependent alcohol dehydrogenase